MYASHILKLIDLVLDKWIASLSYSPAFLKLDRHGHHYVIVSLM